MFTRHVSKDLARYCDGRLALDEARAIEAHLTTCARCRAASAEITFAAGLLRQLTPVAPPSSVWTAVEAALASPPGRRAWIPSLRVAAAWVLVLAAGGSSLFWFNRRPATQTWEVVRLGQGGATVRMAEGDWVDTDGSSPARIIVGEIGTVDLARDTRVRLGEIGPAEYRMILARGTLSAQIAAPPRLFFVETPAGTVVDLGCAYTVDVNEEGTGDLRVTEGWASLEWRGRESLVPAGAHARIRVGAGPGTPYFEDASAALVDALTAFDFAGGGSLALTTVLRASRVRDTLTLWHLLSRADASERPRVYERIAELTPPPPSVSREKALALDPETLRLWREELAWTW